MTDEILNCLFTFFWKCCLEGKGKITTHPLRHPFKTYSYHYQSVITSWNFIPSPFFGGGGGLEDVLFWNLTPGIFHFFPLPRKFQEKTKLHHPWIFHKIEKIPWKFQSQKQTPLEIPHAISLISLKIPYPQPPCLDFFWNRKITKIDYEMN